MHFVKVGVFEASDSHAFSKLMKYREEADDNPRCTFSSEDFAELKSDVDRVIEKIARYLKDKGYA